MKTMLAKLFSWKTTSSNNTLRTSSSKRSLRLEPLEARQMLAVSAVDFNFESVFPFEGQTTEKIVVSSLQDENDGDHSDGNLSLREAIDLANFNSGYSEITFAEGLFQDGDSIILTMGALDITNSNISLIGNDAFVTIDANGSSGVFAVFDSTVFMTGLNITGGKTSHGGGIFGINSNFHLEEVNITNNHATCNGGGVYLGGGSLIASSVQIDGNSADLNGGGMYLGSAKVGLFESVISDNESTREGGGVYQQNGQFYILDSTIQSNTAHTNGGGYLSHNGDVRMEKIRITENKADNNGGGFYHDGANSSVYMSNSIADFNTAVSGGAFFLASNAELYNMTITGNIAEGLYETQPIEGAPDLSNIMGGAIYATSGENFSTKIYNSIIHGNGFSNQENPDIQYGHGGDIYGTVDGANNLIGENGGFEWLGEETNLYGVDPKFVDAENGDYRLSGDSPAINAGNNLYVDGDTDYQGYRRILGSAVDLGIYEHSEYNEWVGPDNGDWFDDANWAYNHVPQAGEKVYIPEGVTVRIADPTLNEEDDSPILNPNTLIIFADEIVGDGNIEIFTHDIWAEIWESHTGLFGGVVFEGLLNINGSILLQKGGIRFQGGAEISGSFLAEPQTSICVENAPVTMTGITKIEGVALHVNNTTLAFPNLASYTLPENMSSLIKVSGENGLLDFSALTSYSNLSGSRQNISIINGGRIDLSKLENLSNVNLSVEKSTLDLSNLAGDTLTNIAFHLIEADLQGMESFTTLVDCDLNVFGDTAFPYITQIVNTSIFVYGNETSLLFSALEQIVIENDLVLEVSAHSGGKINFPLLESVTGAIHFNAEHENSIIDVSNLVEKPEFEITETGGGQVLIKKYIPEQLIVSSLVDENDGRYFEGELSLREAIELAASRNGNTIITFAEETTGTISLVLGELVIDNALVTIIGPGITIDAQQRSRIFNITDSTVALTGMTLVHGYTELDGGGILALDSNLKLRQMTISDCMANGNQTRGGGIYFLGVTESSMTDVVIKNNQSASGGGIGYYFDGGLTLNNVVISENLAQQGGGIYAFGSNTDTAVITMNNVQITGNTAFQENFTGGGIFARNVRLDINRSQITDNQAANGAGITLLGGSILTMNNSLIANNSSQNYVGGIYLGALEDSPVHATLNNVTVTANRGNMGASGIYLFDPYGDSSLTLNNTIVAGNTGNATVDVAGNISGTHNVIGAADDTLTGIVHGESGNLLNVDPLFVNVQERNYHLAVGSPAIDSGNNAFVSENATDLAGRERIANETVDIGAYESFLQASLVLSAEENFTVNEGGEIIFTLICDEEYSYDLIIKLVSSDQNSLTLPEYVVIPAGAGSVTFKGTAIRDYVYTEEDKLVTVTVSCPGFASNSEVVTIVNVDLENPASVVETVDLSGSESANWTVRKNGNLIEIIDDADEVIYSKDHHDFGTLKIVAGDAMDGHLIINYSDEELLALGLNIHFVGNSEFTNHLEILGTDGDDIFQFSPDGNSLNGIPMPLSWENVDAVTVNTGEGTDSFSFNTDAENVNFAFRNGTGSVTVDGMIWNILESDQIDISANNGKSTMAKIHDTGCDDTFLLESNSMTMIGGNCVVHVTGFTQVDAFSLNGGKDLATVVAENHSVIIMNDTFTERREGNQSTRIWYSNNVVAINGDDSSNLLIHQGSKGTDIYNWSESSGTATNSTGKYYHQIQGFNNVNIQVTHQSAIVQLPDATGEIEWIDQEQKKLWISDSLTLGIYGNVELFNVPVSSEPEEESPFDNEPDSQPGALPSAAMVPLQSENSLLNDESDDAFYHFLASEQLTQKKIENDNWKIDWSEQALLDLLYGDR